MSPERFDSFDFRDFDNEAVQDEIHTALKQRELWQSQLHTALGILARLVGASQRDANTGQRIAGVAREANQFLHSIRVSIHDNVTSETTDDTDDANANDSGHAPIN